MRLNPIVKKDVKVQSRSMKICWGVFAYELILAFVFFLAIVVIKQQSRYSANNIYSAMVWIYPALAMTQLVILGIVVPVRTASAISGEKERQTFDIMMTTGMTPFSIIMGKVMTAIIQSMLFVVASLPVMALCFIIGGMSWSYLLWFLAIALLISFFSASIGILCSSLCKRSISAVIMSYGFYLLFFLGTVLPYLIYSITSVNMSYSGPATVFSVSYSYGENWCLFLLLNPAVYLTEFFAQILVGDSIANNLVNLTGTFPTGGPIRYIAVNNRWLIVSTVMFAAVSFLFLWLAAKRINPIKRKARKPKTPGAAG